MDDASCEDLETGRGRGGVPSAQRLHTNGPNLINRRRRRRLRCCSAESFGPAAGE